MEENKNGRLEVFEDGTIRKGKHVSKVGLMIEEFDTFKEATDMKVAREKMGYYNVRIEEVK